MRFSRFQASIFSDFSSIEADPGRTISILQKLIDGGYPFVSGVVQEFNALTMMPSSRLRLSSVDGVNEIVILSGRIDVVRQANVFEGANIGDIDDFFVFVGKSIEAVFGGLKLQGSRLALITQAVSDAFDPDALVGASARFFKFGDFHKENLPFEWTYRLASNRQMSISGVSEPINAILKVDRLQGKVTTSTGSSDFDRIFAEIDVNTSQAVSLNRFDADAFSCFLKDAKTLTIDQFESVNKMVINHGN